ncbi:MAG TPA: MipA/OmpV family protein [Steroidobacteraceae bacterium]|jgi:outer membrane scaffolding protein for murein synthesis (MipA/OmpV family)
MMSHIFRWLCCLTLVTIAWLPRAALAQTPSPLQEWQYSGGIVLARLFEPDLPEWRVIAGAAADVEPVYDGGSAMKVGGGPVFNVYYKDVAYISTGDGLGYNFLRGDHFQIGIAMAYDQGRTVKDDWNNLHGMGDIWAAPVGKLYGAWVLSKKFPLILRLSARQFIGGAQGAVGDASVYMPLPGSSKTFVMFAGPSITMGTRHYLQTEYGVDAQQAFASGHPQYDINRAGTSDAGVGFSATKFVGKHLLINLDTAISQVRGTPARSPLIERKTQRVLALSFEYHFESETAGAP